MPFRYLHAADLHLDTPFEGLAVTAPALRERLIEASLTALDALVETAIREDVSFVVLAGDVYDGAERGLRAQLRLLQATRTLDESGIWTFIAHGNHDPLSANGWSAVRNWPERVRIFPSDHVETVAFLAKDGSPVTVSGISYARPDTVESLHRRFPNHRVQNTRGPGAPFQVAVLHAHVGEHAHHAPYSPCSVEDLVDTGYDAWALGHIHGRQILHPVHPLIAYPGNLQGRSLREVGPKGAFVVDVAEGIPTPRFVELAPIRFEIVEVNADGCADLAALIDRWESAGRTRAAGRPIVARAVAVGRTALYDVLIDVPPEVLLRTLVDRATDGVTWVDLAVNIRPERDLVSLLDRQDLHGELARTSMAVELGEIRALLDPGRFEHPPWTDEELLTLRDEATDLALTLLGSEP